MELNKFISCLKFLHSKMSESITNYYLNERINDWYESDTTLYIVVKMIWVTFPMLYKKII